MKSLRKTLLGGCLAMVLPIAGHAAVSATQTWSFDGGYLKNHSNGKTLCVTTRNVAEQAVMEECGAEPAKQQFLYTPMNYYLQLSEDKSMALSTASNDVITWPKVENPDYWEFKGAQIESMRHSKCLDIYGGSNEKGAKVIIATCTK